MREIKRVGIFGMGALGMLYGSAMSSYLGKENVVYLMDEKRYEKHASDVYSINGEVQDLQMGNAEAVTEPFDLVMVAVKYTALHGLLDQMEKAVGKDTIIVSVMNGITSEEILATRFDREQIVDTVALGMDAMRDGTTLTYTKAGRLQLGVHPGLDEARQKEMVEALVNLYEKSGLAYEVCEDIRRAMWYKFMLNVGINQACTVYETDYGHCTAEGPILDEMTEAMEEVIKVAAAEEINLTREDLIACIEIEKTLLPEGYPSMRQDSVAKRPSEVDMFAGTVMERGKKYGIQTPVNAKWYQAVKEMEAKY